MGNTNTFFRTTVVFDGDPRLRRSEQMRVMTKMIKKYFTYIVSAIVTEDGRLEWKSTNGICAAHSAVGAHCPDEDHFTGCAIACRIVSMVPRKNDPFPSRGSSPTKWVLPLPNLTISNHPAIISLTWIRLTCYLKTVSLQFRWSRFIMVHWFVPRSWREFGQKNFLDSDRYIVNQSKA